MAATTAAAPQPGLVGTYFNLNYQSGTSPLLESSNPAWLGNQTPAASLGHTPDGEESIRNTASATCGTRTGSGKNAPISSARFRNSGRATNSTLMRGIFISAHRASATPCGLPGPD